MWHQDGLRTNKVKAPKSAKYKTECEREKRKQVTDEAVSKLESSQSPHTSAKAMLFARWHHHLRFCSGFPYAPFKAMVTKILK